MHTPTKEQMAVVIEKLYRVLPCTFERKDSLIMLMSRVSSVESAICGSPHCFAGWYMTEANISGEDNWAFSKDYTGGAALMARDLGFKSSYELRSWASDNENIWGNYDGFQMFSSPMAFKGFTCPHGAKTLADIINHLEEVRERLPL